jgi:hypothetical protein
LLRHCDAGKQKKGKAMMGEKRLRWWAGDVKE